MIGIDLGGSKIAYVDLREQMFYELYADKSRSRSYQLREIADFLARLPWSDDKVYIEAPILGASRNAQVLIQIAQVSGLAIRRFSNNELVAVSQWKKAVTGNGRATKAEVRQWLSDHRPDLFSRANRSQDLIDATCIALYGESNDA